MRAFDPLPLRVKGSGSPWGGRHGGRMGSLRVLEAMFRVRGSRV